ncbi:MAG: CDP-alcohol phosphatidyltransferase family protein [Clostridia bacterium]|nr:CDP-alcohol phosphatidyltransferase family protein [Clostridia bacterium]MBQ5716292.1 CDP-alcohol phosphatidyltransferase family protein [Clostridia bacterium]
MKPIFTIPNILSMIRICLIPFIVWYYFDTTIEYNLLIVTGLVMFSGLTDVVDGFIARRFNMISDVGKILDPIADKLTQASVVFCLCTKHTVLIPLVIIIVIKELFMLIGTLVILNDVDAETPYARWWGKLATVVLYALMVLVIISDYFGGFIPDIVITFLSSVAIAFVFFAFLSYLNIFFKKDNK